MYKYIIAKHSNFIEYLDLAHINYTYLFVSLALFRAVYL